MWCWWSPTAAPLPFRKALDPVTRGGRAQACGRHLRLPSGGPAMPDPRAETIDQLLLDRVSAATDLPEPSRDLLFAALVGSDELNAVLGGAVPQKPQPPAADAADDEPIGTYL